MKFKLDKTMHSFNKFIIKHDDELAFVVLVACVFLVVGLVLIVNSSYS